MPLSQDAIVRARQKVLAAPSGVSYFVLFSNQRSAMEAAGLRLLPPPTVSHRSPPITFTVLPAPAPDDVFWCVGRSRHVYLASCAPLFTLWQAMGLVLASSLAGGADEPRCVGPANYVECGGSLLRACCRTSYHERA